ncbi:MAG: tetratricopeptide repeat protein [Thermodesulfobacteriota bacterium]
MEFLQLNPYVIYSALILLGIVIGCLLSFTLCSTKSSSKEKGGEVKKVYLKGINFLLASEHDKAIEEFTKAVKIDSSTIEIYFALGNLFRVKGNVGRAIRIHQSIALRPSLDEKTILTALYELGIDFKKAGFIKRAIATFEEIIQKNPNMLEAYISLEELYEETGEWEKAFVIQQKLFRLKGKKDNAILAHLQAELGKALTEKEGEDKAAVKKIFKKAIALDRGCVDAYLHLGDLYASQGEYSRAIETWKKIPEVSPRFTYLAYPRLQEAYFNLNKFDAMEDLLRDILRRHYNDVHTHLALAIYLYKKNSVEETIRELRTALEINPNFSEARKELGKVLFEQHREKEAFEEYQRLLDKLTYPGKDFQCDECGYESLTLEWKCPKCLKWDTIYLKGIPQKVAECPPLVSKT